MRLLWHIRIVVLEALGLSLVDELTLHLILHFCHQGVDCLVLGRHVHLNLLLTGALHHNVLTLHHRHLHLALHHRLHLLLLGNERDLKGTSVLGIVDHIENHIHVQLTHTSLFNKILHSEHVKTHLLGLLEELLPLLHEVLRNGLG